MGIKCKIEANSHVQSRDLPFDMAGHPVHVPDEEKLTP